MMQEWVKLPSEWIEDGGLHYLRWGNGGEGSNNIAALMTLAAVAHHADAATGEARLTYDVLTGCTGLSRAKLSAGLGVLEGLQVIARSESRSCYQLRNYNPKEGWAKLPAKRLYTSGRIIAFDEFKLRRAAELHALKLYFLFAARRGRDTNMANISYEKIADYAAVEPHRIKAALSILALNNLVHVERVPSRSNVHGVANAYRLVGLESRVHMGTRGRGLDTTDFDTSSDLYDLED